VSHDNADKDPRFWRYYVMETGKGLRVFPEVVLSPSSVSSSPTGKINLLRPCQRRQ